MLRSLYCEGKKCGTYLCYVGIFNILKLLQSIFRHIVTKTVISYCFAVRGGLTLREAIKLMEIIHSTGRLRALDLVEINPAIGNDSDRKRTIEAGLCIVKAALGFSRRGTSPRGVSDLPVQTLHNH